MTEGKKERGKEKGGERERKEENWGKERNREKLVYHLKTCKISVGNITLQFSAFIENQYISC